MNLLIAQLGDIHIADQSDPIFQRTDLITNAICAEITKDTSEAVLLLTGDFVQSGATEEFNLAKQFIDSIATGIVERSQIVPTILCIPGNHDINVGGDQDARNTLLRAHQTNDVPAKSILKVILESQDNFFSFAREIATEAQHSVEYPFARSTILSVGDQRVNFCLLNSAWMSQRHEKTNSIYFPISQTDLASMEGDYVITALHHPLNWFKQPETMRPLSQKIESVSDLIITAHEHGHDHYGKLRPQGLASVDYIEGAVLQERSDFSKSSFNIIKLAFGTNEAQIIRMHFNEGVYERLPGDEVTALPKNPAKRSGTSLSPTPEFLSFLQQTDAPIADVEGKRIKLQDIFTFPDVRERPQSSADQKWTRIKGENLSSEVISGTHCVISSDAKGGKTSLAKRLCVDAIQGGSIAVYINCAEIPSLNSQTAARNWLKRQFDEHYGKSGFNRLEQELPAKSLVTIDNFHCVPKHHDQRAFLLEAVEKVFENVSLFVDMDFVIEESHFSGRATTILAKYREMRICEFGFLKVENLARRWLVSRNQACDDQAIRDVCDVIERVLRINAMPHHPWILIVLLQEASAGHEVAAKNGSYGHLYQAVVTTALSQSMVKLDIQSKYTYLCELALTMYKQNRASLDIPDVKKFHTDHCLKYGVPFEYNETVEDFVRVGILRQTTNQVSFRDKYSYWFFVAWYLGRNIHSNESLRASFKTC